MAISFAQARALVLAHARPLGTERADLTHLTGRVLASPVTAASDLPRFDNSAMDGFGVQVADVAGASKEQPAWLTLHHTIRAGDPAGEELPRGAAVKILTGAPVPAGVEAVVMSEDAQESNGAVAVLRPAKPGDNIRRRGEEYRAGDVAVPAGSRVTPPVAGLLATFGHAAAKVYRRPEIAVIVTGSELAQPGQKLQSPQIYDANSSALATALAALGVARITLSQVSDDIRATEEALSQDLQQADVLLVAGGVSVGEYDFVKDVCAELGVETRFWGVAIKPGKPTYFGTREGRLVFGLPGNPAAVLVTYHQFVKPALLQMMGLPDVSPLLLTARLDGKVKKKRGRLEFVRGQARAEEGTLVVTPTTGQGSHMLGGLADANCLIHVPAETESLAPGDAVQLEFLSWER